VITYLRFLSWHERSKEANRHLGMTLAFVAGAVNAGGFLAVSRYTSHMTGVLSSISYNLALRRLDLAATGMSAFVAFLGGAATSAVLINWAKRKRLHSQYALALMLEAVLLLTFGLLGANLKALAEVLVPATVLLLCYVMGLQNAIITKISHAEIRTTHMTGNATDLGIEIGKLFYWNRDDGAAEKVVANREKLRIHAGLIALFVLGGVAGALGFKRIGYVSTLPLAVLLFVIAIVPVWDDLAAPHAG
jgi:uncharacterized membrane protein YoaK (UPF0700 family)